MKQKNSFNRSDFLKSLQDNLQANGLFLEPSQQETLFHFLNQLMEWNQRINLTAHRTLEDLVEKDIIDILVLNLYIKKYTPSFTSLLDMGAGAGFGGLILGILYPQAQMAFLEANRKKVNFIRHCARELKLPQAHMINERAEAFPAIEKESHQVVISRATWRLPDFLEFAPYYAQPQATLYLMSGPEQELSSAESSKLSLFKEIITENYTLLPHQYKRRLFILRK